MTQDTTKTPTFEEALNGLEELVSAMEEGDIPLADLVEKYEEGTKLLNICEKKLTEAELTIQKLKIERGELILEPFDPESGND